MWLSAFCARQARIAEELVASFFIGIQDALPIEPLGN